MAPLWHRRAAEHPLPIFGAAVQVVYEDSGYEALPPVDPRPVAGSDGGLDLNQRPFGYEYEAAMTGNPLISLQRRSAPASSTFYGDAWFFLLCDPVSGSYGSKMGAAAGTPRLGAWRRLPLSLLSLPLIYEPLAAGWHRVRWIQKYALNLGGSSRESPARPTTLANSGSVRKPQANRDRLVFRRDR
jgi:hypothetical protein